NIKEILQLVEKSQKADIVAYSSGHLNQAKLYKPATQSKRVYQQKAPKPVSHGTQNILLPEHTQQASEVSATNMIDSLADFTLKTCLPSEYLDVHLASSDLSLSTLVSVASLQMPELIKKREAWRKDYIAREELDLLELKLLKPKQIKCGRSADQQTPDQYQFVQSYLAGLTRKDQFRMRMSFDNQFLRKQDLLERNVMSGYKAVEKHERKLRNELMKIGLVCRPHFGRLQVFRDVFGDICNESILCGDILKEIKKEYDVYLEALLDSQPAAQYQTLQAQLQTLERRAVSTEEVKEAMLRVRALEQEARDALQRNEEIRNELESELLVSKPPDEDGGKKRGISNSYLENIGIADQVQAKRCRILIILEELQELKKDIRENMSLAMCAHNIDNCIKDTEVKMIKLQKSNKCFYKAIKSLENEINNSLSKLKATKEEKE
uniref:Translin-associated factor X-interacting protein 1 N-terminal domain-containing protein n=1 Tax=Latimeria chalumnae TaxID=7897 RepID=H3A5P7_LATCH